MSSTTDAHVLFADYAVQDAQGKLVLAGMYEDIVIIRAPLPAAMASFYAVIRVRRTKENLEPFALTIVRPDGEETQVSEPQELFDRAKAAPDTLPIINTNLIIGLSPLIIQKVGSLEIYMKTSQNKRKKIGAIMFQQG